MGVLVQYALVCAMVPVVFYAICKLVQWFVTWDGFGRRPVAPAPAERSIEVLARDLSRLQRDYVTIRGSNQAAKVSRLRAVELAYDDTLCACCVALDLSQPGRPPLDGLARLETEAALAQRGLTW